MVRPGTPKNCNDNGGGGGGFRRALPVGFILSSSSSSSLSSSLSSSSDFGYDWIFARKYDRYTEEMSHEENVDSLTLRNILLAMMDDNGGGGGELKQIAIPYDRFIAMKSSSPSSTSSMDCGNDIAGTKKQQHPLPSWEARTSMISPRFLQQCHKLMHGSKIVPSSYGDDHDHHKKENQSIPNDGISISYPPIPCIDPTIDARRLVQHSGTRSYLSTLTPTERTRLLMFSKKGNGYEDDDDINNSSYTKNLQMMDSAESLNNYRRSQDSSSGKYVWNDVLRRYYGNEVNDNNAFYTGGDRYSTFSEPEYHFLADVELSFILLLYLECQSSLEFWRDAISMCSLSVAITPSLSSASSNIVSRHPLFFHKLLSILYIQLSCIESDFFGDVEYSSGDDNFCVLALKRLCDACDGVVGNKRRREEEDNGVGKNDALNNLKLASQQLRLLARDRFGLDLSSSSLSTAKDGADEDEEVDALWTSTGVDFGEDSEDISGMIETYNCQDGDGNNYDDDDDDDDDEEEDGPVVIPYDEIEESIARSSTIQPTFHTRMRCNNDRADDYNNTEKARTFRSNHCKEYPLLYAAMLSTGEDEVMACARILDEKNDVSLVREAAAYLERVEAHYGIDESS